MQVEKRQWRFVLHISLMAVLACRFKLLQVDMTVTNTVDRFRAGLRCATAV